MKNVLLSLFASVSFFVSAETPTYTVTVEEQPYLPHYKTDNSEYTGYSRELLDLFAKTAGIRFKYISQPYLRGSNALHTGAVDFQYPDNDYWIADIKAKLGIHILYSDPAIKSIDGLHMLSTHLTDDVAKINNIGTVIGFTPAPYLELEKQGKITIHYSPTVLGLIEQVRKGRLDGVYLDVDVVKYSEKDKQPEIVFAQQLPWIESNYKLSTIAHPNIIEQFNQFLLTHKRDIADLQKKYGFIVPKLLEAHQNK